MVDMWVYLEMPCLAISDLQTSVPNLFTLCSGLVLFRSPGITYILLHRSELLKLCLISNSCLFLCFNVEHVLHSIMNALLICLKPKSCISNLATKHLFPSRACLLALSLSLSLYLSRSLARSLALPLSLTYALCICHSLIFMLLRSEPNSQPLVCRFIVIGRLRVSASPATMSSDIGLPKHRLRAPKSTRGCTRGYGFHRLKVTRTTVITLKVQSAYIHPSNRIPSTVLPACSAAAQQQRRRAC